ncbi:MAG TPA: O-antigen ligase family protein [Vicinamibacterales bacterium]|nr:O-antigen ligase family protein [Vicinamibacterales bacterium]
MIRRALAVLPCAALLVALISPGTPHLARCVIVAIVAVTLWSPATGLLATAGLAPFGAYLAALDQLADYRLTEVILLSFIAAWLLRSDDRTQTARGPALPRYAWTAAWFFAVLIASLSFALCRQLLRYPDALSTNLVTIALHYFGYGDPTGISDIARTCEGFAIVAAAMALFRRNPALARSLPIALALSTVAAAAASLLLWFGVAPHQVLAREAVIGYRFSAHVLDPNAAGSQFVLVLCLALGIAMREHGRRRVLWIVAAAACVAGLWMTRSRSAEAAAGLVIPVAFLWAQTTAWTRAKRVALIGGVLIALTAFGIVRAVQIERDPTYKGSGFRQQFVMSSFRVIGTHPYLGIGPGRYFRDSPNFLTPQLAWSYGSENAHNNFLEITTEAGIIGFFLYAAWFAGALGLALRSLARNPRDWRLLGCTAGVVAFLGTCLTGHPLLVPEVATTLFVQLALAAALGGSALLNGAPEAAESARDQNGVGDTTPVIPWRTVTVVGTIAFGVLPAWTLEKPLVPVHLEEVDGMYYADGGIADDVPFQWTRQYASLYVLSSARVVELWLRSPLAGMTKEPTLVEITSGGQTLANALVGDKWTTVTLTLPPPEPPLVMSRINLRSNHTARVADLEPGSSDQRQVGVQVGPIRILRVSWEFVPKPSGTRESLETP